MGMFSYLTHRLVSVVLVIFGVIGVVSGYFNGSIMLVVISIILLLIALYFANSKHY